MKINKLFVVLLLALFCICLASCSTTGVTYDAKDYMLELDYKEDFKIMQLTDIHISLKDNEDRQYAFITKLINEDKPDLIVLDGDNFTFASKRTAKTYFAFFESFDIPWTITWGNHDEQTYFSIDWMTNYLNELAAKPDSNLLFIDHQDDDVYGNANFFINLMDGDKIVEQIIIMDSNRYNYGEYLGYDYIKQDQIDWYERMVEYSTTLNGGEVVESLCFFHIPVPEFETAWDLKEAGSSLVEVIIEGQKGEGISCPKTNSGFFDKLVELKSTKGIFVGHDHLNSYAIKYQGVVLSYGITTTDRIYFDEALLGSQVITLHADHSFDIVQHIHNYSEY